ncbi:MAG: tRNA(fMet)-specific endonuclease VapC [Acidobacteriota bacterium]|jgi:tRNA(fMet)-specific endonuclease VapC|nr:tRNA(fMet)-specific endonuclease VapC [Acidobacteriota bacterium]
MPKNGAKVSLDTNVAIAVLNNTGHAGEWIQDFDEVFLPVPVVGELRFGAINSGRPEKNLARIEAFVDSCSVLDIRLSTTDIYSVVRLGLKRKGKPIPENDVWIAAVCIEHGLSLATSDGHFREVEGLTLATTF